MMDKKLLIPIGVLVVVGALAGVYLATRGGGAPEKSSPAVTEKVVTEKKEETTSRTETEVGCVAGRTKTVLGREYTITGTETHTIQGKSFDLCCWKVGEGKDEKKICADSATMPVGYDNGIFWELDEGTGKVYKATERYLKEGKRCQQLYNADGTLGPEHCD